MKVAYNGQFYNVGRVKIADSSGSIHIPWHMMIAMNVQSPAINESYSFDLSEYQLTPEVADSVYIFWYQTLEGSETERLYICVGAVDSIDTDAESTTVIFSHVTAVNQSSGVHSDTVDAIAALSQEELNAIPVKDERTLYVVKG